MHVDSVASAGRESKSCKQIFLATHFLCCTDQLLATEVICLCRLRSCRADSCNNVQYSSAKLGIKSGARCEKVLLLFFFFSFWSCKKYIDKNLFSTLRRMQFISSKRTENVGYPRNEGTCLR